MGHGSLLEWVSDSVGHGDPLPAMISGDMTVL